MISSQCYVKIAETTQGLLQFCDLEWIHSPLSLVWALAKCCGGGEVHWPRRNQDCLLVTNHSTSILHCFFGGGRWSSHLLGRYKYPQGKSIREEKNIAFYSPPPHYDLPIVHEGGWGSSSPEGCTVCLSKGLSSMMLRSLRTPCMCSQNMPSASPGSSTEKRDPFHTSIFVSPFILNLSF